MPRPPVLPTIDWQAVFGQGVDYQEWLARFESDDCRERIERKAAGLSIPVQIQAFVEALPKKVYVVAIAEDWCGDVVHHVPVLARLAALSANIEVRYLTREERPDVFTRFLTNGGEAIPKFIFLSEDFVECGNWGPMSAQCREILARGKAANDVGSAREKVSMLYQADSNMSLVIQELIALFDIAASQ